MVLIPDRFGKQYPSDVPMSWNREILIVLEAINGWPFSASGSRLVYETSTCTQYAYSEYQEAFELLQFGVISNKHCKLYHIDIIFHTPTALGKDDVWSRGNFLSQFETQTLLRMTNSQVLKFCFDIFLLSWLVVLDFELMYESGIYCSQFWCTY